MTLPNENMHVGRGCVEAARIERALQGPSTAELIRFANQDDSVVWLRMTGGLGPSCRKNT